MLARRLAPLVLAAACAAPTLAQTPRALRPEIRATFAETAPRIDGRLDDAVWAVIEPVRDFTQVWPEDGSAATEASEVRIAYDRDFLYFAFDFHDSEPHLIRAKNLERGGRNDRDDHAYIGLDTFQDGRNAYLFEMNALGTQDDATIADESLSIDSFSWDAVFRSETYIGDDGWSMEVAIPFRQLRFPEGDEISFGLMLSRTINRKNERVLWPAIGLEFGGSFAALAAVSQYGTLTGLRGIRRGHNLEIKPYLTLGQQRARPALGADLEGEFSQDFGVDIKYGLTSNLTLDLTVNTDFAQVEADNVQVNLGRFSLFFPEKREFFLERGGLFLHGRSRATQTFFSRRIGLEDQILGGARMTGQVGRFAVGLMSLETGEKLGRAFGPRSSTNSVARIQTNPLPRTTIGGIVTSLIGPDFARMDDPVAPEPDARLSNHALGVDAQVRFWGRSEISGWYTRVFDTRDSAFVRGSYVDPDDAAGMISARLQNDRWRGDFAYENVGTNYAPALGFVRRQDMRRYSAEGSFSPVIEIAALPFVRRLGFSSGYEYIEGQDGEQQTTEFEVGAQVEFNRRDNMSVEVSRETDRPEMGFPIVTGKDKNGNREFAFIAPGAYAFDRVFLRGETDSSRPLYGSASVGTGGYYGGDRSDFGATVGFRQSQYLALEAGVNFSTLDLPVENGSFEATTLSLSILGAVNRDLFAKALIQYDNLSRDLQANIRINWIHTPGSDLFLVFNTSYNFPGGDRLDPRDAPLLNNRVGVAKLTYLVLL